MKKEEYIKAVLEQVRCSTVHEPLKKELEAHIDDQAEAFIAVGLPEENAEEEAVKTMGDPIETGVGLDAAHRPRVPGKVFAAAAVLMLLGAVMRYMLAPYFEFVEGGIGDIAALPLGIGAAVLFYFLDYTAFARFPKTSYVAFVILMGVGLFGVINITDILNRGDGTVIQITGLRETARQIAFYGSMLLVPFMCGFAFSMRGKGFGGFVLTCLALVVPPAFIALYAPCVSALVLSGIYALAVMTIAVKNGFFKVRKTVAYLFMYIPALLAAAGVTALKIWRDSRNEHMGVGWEQDYVRGIISGAKLFGRGNVEGEFLTNANDAHLLTAVIAQCGLAAGALTALAVTALPIAMLIMSGRVQNSFGRLTAFSIGIVFMLQAVWFLSANIGVTTALESYVTAPFMSGGGFNAIACGILVGIFASVYRRKDLMPERKLDTGRPAKKVT